MDFSPEMAGKATAYLTFFVVVGWFVMKRLFGGSK